MGAPAPLPPAAPGSRRAAREARQAVESAAPIPAPAQVAAPFGMFDAPQAPDDHARRSGRERTDRRGAARKPAAAPRAASASASRASGRSSVRKRLSAAGTMVLVGGLFVSLTLPAYGSSPFSDELAEAAAAKTGSQTVALDAASIESASAVEARDGYDTTSAVELKRLYRDALRQKRIQEYAASGAMEMGDDYPWATQLGMDEGGGLSPLNYFIRQCTDFVAWRLNRDAGSTRAPFKYTWSYLTPGGGSAHSWKSQWERHGWATSTTPAPGWVAWFPGANHVAYVNSVLADGSVVIEEYNWGPDTYNQRIIPASSAIYLSPPPA